mmetsp:Transcript_12184/g.51300  ORF Transcript_12184/g.51300 Transcript_12184/m.51300 type:complete len:349 (+) Transcript_12184:2195-3241(+)
MHGAPPRRPSPATLTTPIPSASWPTTYTRRARPSPPHSTCAAARTQALVTPASTTRVPQRSTPHEDRDTGNKPPPLPSMSEAVAPLTALRVSTRASQEQEARPSAPSPPRPCVDAGCSHCSAPLQSPVSLQPSLASWRSRAHTRTAPPAASASIPPRAAIASIGNGTDGATTVAMHSSATLGPRTRTTLSPPHRSVVMHATSTAVCAPSAAPVPPASGRPPNQATWRMLSPAPITKPPVTNSMPPSSSARSHASTAWAGGGSATPKRPHENAATRRSPSSFSALCGGTHASAAMAPTPFPRGAVATSRHAGGGTCACCRGVRRARAPSTTAATPASLIACAHSSSRRS